MSQNQKKSSDRQSVEADLFRQATKLRDSGDLEEALATLERLEASASPDASIAASLVTGSILRKVKNFEDAAVAFRRVVEARPRSETASLGLFHSLWEASEHEKAIEEMRRFLKLRQSSDYKEIASELGIEVGIRIR